MADWPLSGDGQRFETLGRTTTATATAAETVLAAASIGGYGAWTQIPLRDSAGAVVGTGATTFHAAGFIYGAGTSVGTAAYAIDVGIGASAGAVTTLVQRLYINNAGAAARGGYSVYIPIAVPAGTLMWVRNCTNVAAAGQSATHTITMCGAGWRGQSFSVCDTYNMTGTVFNGTATDGVNPTAINFCDPGGVAGVYSNVFEGTYRNISSIASPATTVLQRDYSAVTFVIAFKTADTFVVTARHGLDVGIGSLTAPNLVWYSVTSQATIGNDRFVQPFFGPIPLSLPAGTLVVARSIISAAAAVNYRETAIIMYCFA